MDRLTRPDIERGTEWGELPGSRLSMIAGRCAVCGDEVMDDEDFYEFPDADGPVCCECLESYSRKNYLRRAGAW